MDFIFDVRQSGGGGGMITGGTSLGGTYPIFAGQVGTVLTFNGISLGANLTGSISGGALTISTSGPADFVWNNVTTSTQALGTNQGYVTNNGATLVTYTLPATAVQGNTVVISGYSSGGWTIHQNAGQQILFDGASTTVGTGGSLSSNIATDQVTLLCVIANTTWVVQNSVGNLTIV